MAQTNIFQHKLRTDWKGKEREKARKKDKEKKEEGFFLNLQGLRHKRGGQSTLIMLFETTASYYFYFLSVKTLHKHAVVAIKNARKHLSRKKNARKLSK